MQDKKLAELKLAVFFQCENYSKIAHISNAFEKCSEEFYTVIEWCKLEEEYKEYLELGYEGYYDKYLQ